MPSTLPLLLCVYTGIWKDIPCKSEYSNKFISIQIGPFIFKDSYLFLNKSLDYLTGTINDNDRISLKQEFEEDNYKLLTKKGIYPYDHFDNKDKYDEL